MNLYTKCVVWKTKIGNEVIVPRHRSQYALREERYGEHINDCVRACILMNDINFCRNNVFVCTKIYKIYKIKYK